MNGWIIYQKEDVEKNIAFISRLTAELSKYGLNSKLVFLGSEPKNETPSFAINRSRDYHIAKKLELKGVRVFNGSELTQISNNKKMTLDKYKDSIPVMPFTSDYPCVIKSVNGHGGKEVFLAEAKEDEDAIRLKLKNKEYIKQEVCTDKGKDKRVYIVGNRIVAAILRESDSFKSNYSLGAKATLSNVNQEEKEIIDKILEKEYIDYAGIDFIYNNGHPVFNEIEDPVGAKMLYENTEIDIISVFAEYVIDELNKNNQ